jgi:SAM-dependent methyltransferase
VANPAVAFDALAADYDARFTDTCIGSLMRRAVWSRCQARFARGARILEMNCGTGEDALWLADQGMQVLATDVSPSMLDVAERKRAASPCGAAVSLQRLAWEDLGSLTEGPFDGALSNFGGLNCVEDIAAAAHALAGRLRPGAVAVLCVMGPLVPWEWGWFLARAQPAHAWRRLRRAEWSGLRIRYPSIRRTCQAFSPDFRLLRTSALGALLPPPYVEGWIGRYPRLVRGLERVERRFETRWPLPHLADHYLVELERR